MAPTSSPELIYLGWGRRDFSGAAITNHLNPGWSYVALLEGTVRITLSDGEVALSASDCLIAAPDCGFGLRHLTGETCRLLVWIFKQPPELNALRPNENSHRIIQKDRRTLESIERLHTQSREEVAQDCAFAPDAVRHLRALLDIILARSDHAAHDEHLFRLARQWLLNNLEVRDPVNSLCDYLDLPPHKLRQIFHDLQNTSPGSYHQQLRMLEAQRLISEEGWMVKQAAFRLGYRHPNDLSRAMARFRNRQDAPTTPPHSPQSPETSN